MEKVKKIIAVLLIIFTIYSTLLTTYVNASQASISVPSNVVNGSKYTVTVVIPSDAIGYQGIIKVTYSNGSTDSSGMLAVLDTNLEKHPGNMTATFTAKAAGKATVTVEECSIATKTAESIDPPKSITFNIAEKTTPVNNTAKNTTTTNTTTNTTPTTTNTTTQTNTTTTNTTTDTSGKETFKDVNETVYVYDTETLNIRKTNSKSGTLLGSVKKGTKLTRTGIGSVKWSRVTYNGQTGYAISSCLTTTAPKETETKTTFKEVNEKMYANQNCNLRKEADKNSDLAGYLKEGDEITRIGIGTGADGASWSKIKYNGKEVYVKSSLLTNKKPEVDNTVNEVSNNTIANSIDNNTVNETNMVDTNEILETIREEVGVLPEVGTNPAVVIHSILSTFAIAFSVLIIYINKNKE